MDTFLTIAKTTLGMMWKFIKFVFTNPVTVWLANQMDEFGASDEYIYKKRERQARNKRR